MPTITTSDLDRMQTQGRLVATKDNQQAFEAAAENLAVAMLEDDENNTSTYTRLWIWFEEGARNYVDGQWHLDGIQKRLRERARELYEEAKK